jgi:uncharacterized repeat protein (TIGR01451 family)
MVTQTAPSTVEIGEDFDLQITVVNKGPTPALAVEVVDILPEGMTIAGVLPGQCIEDPDATMICDEDPMLADTERTIDLTLSTGGRACESGVPSGLTNSVTVANIARFAGPDLVPVDNSSSLTITPVDTTPPSVEAIAADPARLWPPNHQMVPVTLSIATADACDEAPVCRITDVTANEPINGPGDGNTEPDWEMVSDLVVNLRAERAGPGDGRIYTVAARCTDASGNGADTTVEVIAPHSAR